MGHSSICLHPNYNDTDAANFNHGLDKIAIFIWDLDLENSKMTLYHPYALTVNDNKSLARRFVVTRKTSSPTH